MTRPVQLGLRANAAQFGLLVLVNALVGAMVGQERVLVPLLAEREFGIQGATTMLTFLVAFGVVKAITNLLAGTLADRFGRRPVLLAGWLVGLPVPLLLAYAPSWPWIVVANVLLGVNQGLTWTTTVVMKVDLAGPRRRGLATGLNEAAGYGAVAITAFVSGNLAQTYGLRPVPFLVGIAYVVLGLGLSTFLVKETTEHVALERRHQVQQGREAMAVPGARTQGGALVASVRQRRLLGASQAGLVNNLNDALTWGLVPVLLVASGASLSRVAAVSATYPAVWALGQLVTGPLSDRVGRRGPVVAGMLVQAVGLVGFAVGDSAPLWFAGAVLLGVGTALVYPTLLAAVSDFVAPERRGGALGAYRFWRDMGFALGGLSVGAFADLLGMRGAVWVVATITAGSGVAVAWLWRRDPRVARIDAGQWTVTPTDP